MSALQPYGPQFGATVTITASAASQQFTIGDKTQQVRILNVGSNMAWCHLSIDSTITASANDFPLAPNSEVVLTRMQDAKYFALISTGAGNTVYVTPVTGWK